MNALKHIRVYVLVGSLVVIVQPFPGLAQNLVDPSYIRRVDKFLEELIWMSQTLRHGRENIPL